MKRDSTLEDWERFWDRNKHVEEIYPASESIIENLAAVTDVNGKKILEVGLGSRIISAVTLSETETKKKRDEATVEVCCEIQKETHIGLAITLKQHGL